MKAYILAITGASGSSYGIEALTQLIRDANIRVHLIVSSWGKEVLRQETGKTLEEYLSGLTPEETGRITLYDHGDMGASVSSGSYPIDGMLIAPCSMGTLCSIASGISGNLIERAAGVTLKERRPLVLLARETPLSTIYLEQMAVVSRAGAVVMPPLPALYLKPKSIEEMIEKIIQRALIHIGAEQKNFKGWNYETP